MSDVDRLLDLPTPVLTLLGVLTLGVLVLLGYTLSQWWRTPADRFTSLPKWAWLPIILVSQPFGPIVFLAIGRKPARADIPEEASQKHHGVANVLYGEERKP